MEHFKSMAGMFSTASSSCTVFAFLFLFYDRGPFVVQASLKLLPLPPGVRK